MEASIPTLIDNLAALLTREDVAEQPAVENSLQPCIDLLTLGGLALLRIALLPPSSGYERLLIENEYDPIVARSLAYVAVRFGTRQAKESRRVRPIHDALRFLTKPRRKGAIFTRAKTILAAWEQSSIVETIFDEAGLRETEFINLLKAVVSREHVDYQRLTEIAADLAPRLSLTLGPKISAASASHGFILEHEIKLTKRRQPHSRKDRTAENCDALTEATRREFAEPDFDSRPARRRSKRREGANIN
jgi:hypothetical protein